MSRLLIKCQVGCDVRCSCWRSSNNGFCSFGCCSGIHLLLWYSVCMYICSNGSSSCGLLIGFRSVIVLLILPYSCLLLSICNAYAERGSLFFIYRVCSWYLAFRLWLVCPTYALRHVLHVILYTPLLSWCYRGLLFLSYALMKRCGGSECYTYIRVFNHVGNCSYFRAMVGESGKW